jgi:hypothetical protein
MKSTLLAPSMLAAAFCLPIAAPAQAGAVDTCAMLPEATVVASTGKLTKPPAPQPAVGSQLGGCQYESVKATVAFTAYPADQLNSTVRRDLKKGRAKAISGLGEKAYQTEYGVMFQPAGKPWFLVVFAMKGTDYDAAMSEQLARQIKL